MAQAAACICVRTRRASSALACYARWCCFLRLAAAVKLRGWWHSQSGAWEEQRAAQCAEMDAHLERAVAAKKEEGAAAGAAAAVDIKEDPEAAAQAVAAAEVAANAPDAAGAAQDAADQADPFNLDALLPDEKAQHGERCGPACVIVCTSLRPLCVPCAQCCMRHS